MASHKGKIELFQLSDTLQQFIIDNGGGVVSEKQNADITYKATSIVLTFEHFDKATDILFVFKNSVYQAEGIDYNISYDSKFIIPATGVTWEGTASDPIHFNFITMRNVPTGGGAPISGQYLGDGTVTLDKLAEDVMNAIASGSADGVTQAQLETVINDFTELKDIVNHYEYNHAMDLCYECDNSTIVLDSDNRITKQTFTDPNTGYVVLRKFFTYNSDGTLDTEIEEYVENIIYLGYPREWEIIKDIDSILTRRKRQYVYTAGHQLHSGWIILPVE